MRRRPIFELGMLLFAHRMEDRHWQRTLHNLAAHFGVNQPVEYPDDLSGLPATVV
jgi:hypothetical protein